MSESMGALEPVLVAIMALLVVLWFRPGLRAALERSRTAEPRWKDLLLPLAWVVAFVIFLLLIS